MLLSIWTFLPPSHHHCFYENRMGKNIHLEKTEKVCFFRAPRPPHDKTVVPTLLRHWLNEGLRKVPSVKPWTLIVFSHLIGVVTVPEWEHPIDLRKDKKGN